MALIPLEEPTGKRLPAQPLALFALGFRPFYLLAALYTAVTIPVWVLLFFGVIALPQSMPGVWWHAHEMLFGFAIAAIVGFLFTAGRNWTGIDTPSGGSLAALVALWFAGRIAMTFDSGITGAIIDIAFLPLAAMAFLRVLLKAKSSRNYFIAVLLALMAIANLYFHLAVQGAVVIDPLKPLHCALALIITLESIIAGRVVPMFTFNALRVKQWRNAKVDMAATVLTGIALLLWGLEYGAWAGIVCLIAAALQLVRIWGWNPLPTWRVPLLWILHAASLWIPVGLILLALSQWGILPRAAGVHALGIGATGGLIIGMITRTALGHTGRMLKAGIIETVIYALVQLTALTRVLTATAIIPAAISGGIHLAATLWSVAFLVYLWRYVPFLLKARADGRPG